MATMPAVVSGGELSGLSITVPLTGAAKVGLVGE
jgi:hypothetical protein